MYKVVFFQKEGEEKLLPVKVLCSKEDTNEKIEEKANLTLSNILEDECEILDYEIIEIRNLQ